MTGETTSTTGYANRKSGGVESAVTLWVRLPPRSLIERSGRFREKATNGSRCFASDVTNKKGLLVKREDAWLATRKSGFDSPAVHSVREPRAHTLLPSPLAGEGLGVRGLGLEQNGR